MARIQKDWLEKSYSLERTRWDICIYSVKIIHKTYFNGL